MQYDLFNQPIKYKLISLASGSNGNCYYIGTSKYGLLIDAGIGLRTIRKNLRDYGISMDTILGVLVTHDHADHIKSIGSLGGKLNIPIYATEAVHFGIQRSKYLDQDINASRKIIMKEQSFKIKNFEIVAFDVPHDSIENVGYQIRIGDKTIVLITDIGRITDTITNYASSANHLIFESNYDENMLRFGKYPDYLKQRIASGMGHLSNRLAGEFISSIYKSHLEEVWLCHLSKDNNSPEIAFNTIEDILNSKNINVGKDLKLETLMRGKPSGLKEFEISHTDLTIST